MLVNANLSEHLPGDNYVTKILSRGKYYDYTPEWFRDVGKKLMVTMMVQAVLPIVNVIKTLGLRYVRVLWDTKGTMNPHVTRCKTVEDYMNLYEGAEYLTYIKFANALNLLYIAMTYGIGIPVLYPLAGVAILINFCAEKLLIIKDA